MAFKLYDTYGFPLDLVQDTLREEALVLDLEGFEANMKRQREASRQSWRGGAAGEVPPVYQELAQWPPTHFLGYDSLEADSTILALITHEGHHEQAEPGEEVEVIAAATPFYGESGGQVGDTGQISGDGWRIRVTDTQRLPNDLYIHQGVVEEGTVKVNDEAVLSVDSARRRKIVRHHTATHILQAVLRRHLGEHVKQSGSLVTPDRLRFDFTHFQAIAPEDTATHILQAVLRRHLGEHVKQSGSLVTPERLRFDFTHFKAIAPEEVEQIELDINAAVAENLPVLTDRLSMAEALERGATALFEEKYGEEVRVVAVPGLSQELCGGTHAERTGDGVLEVRVVAVPGLSQELCGGTHAERTGDLGFCKITSEASVAAGIRRIEAVCGPEAVALTQELAREMDQAAALLKGSRTDFLGRLEKTLKRQKELEKDVAALKSRMAAAQAGDLLDQVRSIEGVPVLALKVEAADPKGLRDFAVKLQQRLQSGVVVLGAAAGDKAMLIALVSKDLTKKFPAGEIIKAIAPAVGGSGGGRPDLAQAGGPDVTGIPKALEQAYEVVAKKAKG